MTMSHKMRSATASTSLVSKSRSLSFKQLKAQMEKELSISILLVITTMKSLSD